MGSYRTISRSETDQRKQNEIIVQMMDGKTNNTGKFTVTASAATTVVSDLRVGADSVILVSPTTATAATEWASGAMYVSSIGKQTFTVTHNNSAPTDRVFTYAVIG
mgnify:CR=1 FL=1|jgi:hypothetical protein